MKNLITNFLGLVFWILSIYEYFTDKNLYTISGLVVIGAILFLFENSKLKEILNNIIKSKTNK